MRVKPPQRHWRVIQRHLRVSPLNDDHKQLFYGLFNGEDTLSFFSLRFLRFPILKVKIEDILVSFQFPHFLFQLFDFV